MGRYAKTVITFFEDVEKINEWYLKVKDLDRISKEDYALWSEKFGTKYAKTYEDAGIYENIEISPNGLVIPLIDSVIVKYPEVKRIVNVGCNYGILDYKLALKYPNYYFIGVDLMHGGIDANKKKFKSQNLEYRQGYALDMLKKNQLSGDLLFHCSTLTKMYPLELKSYFLSARKSGFRFIILNEPVWRFQKDAFYNFDKETDSQPIDGFNFIHNYPRMLIDCGYDILHFNVFYFNHPFTNRCDTHRVTVIAKIKEKR